MQILENSCFSDTEKKKVKNMLYKYKMYLVLEMK